MYLVVACHSCRCGLLWRLPSDQMPLLGNFSCVCRLVRGSWPSRKLDPALFHAQIEDLTEELSHCPKLPVSRIHQLLRSLQGKFVQQSNEHNLEQLRG